MPTTDVLTCVFPTDVFECEHSTQNDCDKVNGVCVDEPVGSYTCGCKTGYYMAIDGTCQGESLNTLVSVMSSTM